MSFNSMNLCSVAYLVFCTFYVVTSAYHNFHNPKIIFNKRSGSESSFCDLKDHLKELLLETDSKEKNQYNFDVEKFHSSTETSKLPYFSDPEGDLNALLKDIYKNLYVRIEMIKKLLETSKEEAFDCEFFDEMNQKRTKEIIKHDLNNVLKKIGRLHFEAVKPVIGKWNLDVGSAKKQYGTYLEQFENQVKQQGRTALNNYACALIDSDQYEALRRFIADEEEKLKLMFDEYDC